tara:strand:- start:1015 stop:1248 length:234 start_codon:yes stop_codon:yes gene_type:complete
MNEWKEWTKEKPESMLTVITHHNGKIGTDWVDNEMVRDAANGKKPVSHWMHLPKPPTIGDIWAGDRLFWKPPMVEGD